MKGKIPMSRRRSCRNLTFIVVDALYRYSTFALKCAAVADILVYHILVKSQKDTKDSCYRPCYLGRHSVSICSWVEK